VYDLFNNIYKIGSDPEPKNGLMARLLAHKLFQKKFDQKLLAMAWSTGATVVFDQKRKPFEKRFDRKQCNGWV
jgi:hypothetical protein